MATCAVNLPTDADREGTLASLYNEARAMRGLPHTNTPGQSRLALYSDARTKNAISRSDESSKATPSCGQEGGGRIGRRRRSWPRR